MEIGDHMLQRPSNRSKTSPKGLVAHTILADEDGGCLDSVNEILR